MRSGVLSLGNAFDFCPREAYMSLKLQSRVPDARDQDYWQCRMSL